MASTADIKKGLCIRFNHDIYKIIEFLHVKPGKGPAFVRTKLKSVTTGKTIDNTFSAGHKIDDVRVETRSFQYLYPEGEELVFMNVEDFNQVHIRRDMLDYPDLLKEGEVVMIIFNAEDETPLSVENFYLIVLQKLLFKHIIETLTKEKKCQIWTYLILD